LLLLLLLLLTSLTYLLFVMRKDLGISVAEFTAAASHSKYTLQTVTGQRTKKPFGFFFWRIKEKRRKEKRRRVAR